MSKGKHTFDQNLKQTNINQFNKLHYETRHSLRS